MDGSEDAPRCANQVHLGPERGRPEPTLVCSCPAGLVHMHDCPVTLGLGCVHFRPLEGEPRGVPPGEYERLHDGLMESYLSRVYFHRIRRLSPGGYAWQRRREEIAADFDVPAEGAGERPASEAEAEEDASYERERERLLERRREREALRKEREEKTREERAQERARMGIKTVVERARETVAQQGNVMGSILDDVELPPAGRRRRRRRRGGGGGGAGEGGPQAPEGAKRRRRRRRRGGGEPPPGSPPPV